VVEQLDLASLASVEAFADRSGGLERMSRYETAVFPLATSFQTQKRSRMRAR
jgi:hypothetical protein